MPYLWCGRPKSSSQDAERMGRVGWGRGDLGWGFKNGIKLIDKIFGIYRIIYTYTK